MPNLDEAPREIASTVKQGSTTLKKTHPMIIVAAVAVTIFSAVDAISRGASSRFGISDSFKKCIFASLVL